MRLKKAGESYLIELQEDEELIEALEEIATRHAIECAWMRAIGSFKEVELVYYDQENDTLSSRRFTRVELASLQGHLTLEDGKPIVNAHGVIGGPSFRAWAGRIRKAVASSGVELLITPLKECYKLGSEIWNLPAA